MIRRAQRRMRRTSVRPPDHSRGQQRASIFPISWSGKRNLPVGNPCTNFKELKDPRAKAKRRLPTYKQDELDRIFARCNEREGTIFATLFHTGLWEQELCHLT